MAYTTAAAVKTYLGISSATDDTLIGTLVAAAQSAIDVYTRRVFECSSATARLLDAESDTDPQRQILYLRDDLCTVTAVVNGDGVTVTAAQYVTEPRDTTPYYALRLKASSSLAWTYVTDQEGAISVTGKWAYSATAPADVVQAATRLAAWMYRAKDAQVFESTAFSEGGSIRIRMDIPADIKALLDPYRRLVG